MTNDDKVKLANEILTWRDDDEIFHDDVYVNHSDCLLDTPTLKAIVSEWLQFTQRDDVPCGHSLGHLRLCNRKEGHLGDHFYV